MTKELTTTNPFLPATFGEALQMAEVLAKSNIVPKDYQGSPGNVLVAMQWGAEIGLKPLQAMQNIAVINGRPSIWGDAMLALVRGSGLLKSFEETHDSEQATCTAERIGGEYAAHTFTKEDAKRAGLWGKSGPWQTYPSRMLQMRARAWVLRDLFPDVLKGLSIAEEVQDIPIEKDITPPKPPASPAERVEKALPPEIERADVDMKPSALASVLAAIRAAQSLASLKKTVGLTESLSDSEKEVARAAYKERAVELKSTDKKEIQKSSSYQAWANEIADCTLVETLDFMREEIPIDSLLSQEEKSELIDKINSKHQTISQPLTELT